MYPQSMFLAKIRKIFKKFHLKMNIFTAVKYCCILHGRVFVMLCHLHKTIKLSKLPGYQRTRQKKEISCNECKTNFNGMECRIPLD